MFVNEITLVVTFDDKAVCLTCAVNVQFYPQMKQSSSGQIRASLPNGPSLPAHPVPRGPAVRPPCIPPLLTNGPLPPSVANNHTPGTRANGDVPYLHPNTLPHNCTSPGDTRKSQHLHSAQVRSYTTPVGHGVMTPPPPASVVHTWDQTRALRSSETFTVSQFTYLHNALKYMPSFCL